ncbi:MAG: O-linked N-acetylglucosamine transferase family protein, partial [Aureliella sp.]
SALSIRPSYKDAHDGYLMCWQYHPEVTPERLLEEHLNWNQKQAEMVPARSEFSARPASAQRLRLGFVSADLGAHPVGYFTLNVLESLDRDRFAIHVYSDRVGRDAVAQRIEKRADQWLDSAAMSDKSLSQRIGEDRIDILFDLAGHTAQNRLLVFARRAAPIQITWAGYVGTTGVKNMDYLLADRFHLPPGQEKHYCERVLRMPHGYICYSPPADSPPVGPLPALTNGYVTFGAMCNPTKVNAAVLSAWGRVLQAVPGSRLLLCYKGWPDVTNRRRVVEALDAFGAGERVEFRQRSGPAEVMASYGEVDLALDTFPYSGGLTACEAIWMGVPTITLPGSTFAGRHSLSHLSNVGLVQCIASDLDDYVARAVEQASRLDELAELRKGLRNQMAASPLCDGARFAADFAQVLEQAVREFNG